MKNVTKRIFTLLLIGVAAVSVFNFGLLNNRTYATEANFKGTLIIHHRSGLIGHYTVTFTGENNTKTEKVSLSAGLNKKYTIPHWANRAEVEFKVLDVVYWVDGNSQTFYLNGYANSESKIEVTGKVSFKPFVCRPILECDVKNF